MMSMHYSCDRCCQPAVCVPIDYNYIVLDEEHVHKTLLDCDDTSVTTKGTIRESHTVFMYKFNSSECKL